MYPLRASSGTTSQRGESSTFHPSESTWSSILEQTKQNKTKAEHDIALLCAFLFIRVLEFVNEGTANDTSASVEMGSDRGSILRPLHIDRTVFGVYIAIKEAWSP